MNGDPIAWELACIAVEGRRLVERIRRLHDEAPAEATHALQAIVNELVQLTRPTSLTERAETER